MKKGVWIIAGLIVLVVLIVIFSGGETQAPTTPIGGATPPPAAAPKSVTLTLSSQNNSGESGTATIMEEAGKSRVVINLTGALAVAKPAHIHTGSCPNPGAVKYPLTNVVNGVSETVLTVTFDEIMADLPLAVNVHKSGTDIQTYVACGNIIREY